MSDTQSPPDITMVALVLGGLGLVGSAVLLVLGTRAWHTWLTAAGSFATVMAMLVLRRARPRAG